MKRSVHMRLLFVVVFIISIGQCFAQSESPKKEFVEVYFRQSATQIDPHYRNNEAVLRRFIDAVNESRCDKVRIVASVSPEGLDVVNERILKERAATIQKWINIYSTKPVDYVVEYKGIDWERLIKLIEERKESRYLPCRAEVLDILRNTPEHVADKPIGYSWRFAKLAKLQNGDSYIWLKRYLFPELRYATAEFVVSLDVVDDASIQQIADDSTSSDEAPSLPPPLPSEGQSTDLVEDKSNAFCVALKTNMLYLLAAVPNLGIEMHMGGGWSLAANWQYAWWSNDTACWYHRIYGGDVALRKWFGKQAASTPLSGHHLGIYGQMATYDFVFGKGRIGQLADKWSYGGGLEYGYSLPAGKALRFDFTLGVGYFTGIYKTYELQDECYVWQQTLKRNYLGPTKAEIALVWVIGGKKGGTK